MSKKQTTFNFRNTKTIITYDLSENDVSAGTIASKSNYLFTTINVGAKSYSFPNTTLSSTLDTAKKAEAEFKEAFNKTGSKAKISRLFIVEVDSKNGYIENNE